MAKRKRKSASRARTRSTSARSARSQASAGDAIALLKGDHRQVEAWFEEFESSRSDAKKKTLATNICQALKVHTQIESEVFYPAFLEATEEEDIHHEAVVEHDGAKKLIAEIEASGPEDDYYDAKVKVLSEMIKHHVNEEEQRDGMFAKARQSDMDLKALGEQLAARKAELMSGEMGDEDTGSRRRSASRASDSTMMARMAKRMRGE
jgi:hemerythrin superfamily protein